MYNQNVLAAAPIGCDVHSKDRRLMTVALSNNVFGCSYTGKPPYSIWPYS